MVAMVISESAELRTLADRARDAGHFAIADVLEHVADDIEETGGCKTRAGLTRGVRCDDCRLGDDHD